jgi:uncharacterized membrane protein (UPF0136 family)
MYTFALAVLLIYAALMLVGGFIGYRVAGSRGSLAAGAASAALLFASYFWARSFPGEGFFAAAVVALLLAIVFGMRVARTRKMMPSGMLLLVSIAAFVVLLAASLRLQ